MVVFAHLNSRRSSPRLSWSAAAWPTPDHWTPRSDSLSRKHQQRSPPEKASSKASTPSERKLVIKHGPIRALQMPGMTMPFGVAPDVDLSGLAPGAKVKFTLGRDATGIYVIDQISRAK